MGIAKTLWPFGPVTFGKVLSQQLPGELAQFIDGDLEEAFVEELRFAFAERGADEEPRKPKRVVQSKLRHGTGPVG